MSPQGSTRPAGFRALLLAGPAMGARALAALLVRGAAGLVFLAFGAGKFTAHGSEVTSFRKYGLPSPDAFAYAIGALELTCGALVLVGLGTRLAALLLIGDMIAAIVTSGLEHGELISLTLAPVLLVAMAFLVWTGSGMWASERALAPRRQGPRTDRP